MVSPSRRLCVIGGGAAGIATAKQAMGAGFKVQLLEQTDDVGGVWRYRDSSDTFSDTTSMYDGVFTNLPCEAMAFRDWPWDQRCQRFPHHSHVLKYLHSYADTFGVNRVVSLRHVVKRVTPNTQASGWVVTVQHADDSHAEGDPAAEEQLEFDFIAVCTGHFRVSSLPNDIELSAKAASVPSFACSRRFGRAMRGVPSLQLDEPGESDGAGIHVMHSHSYKTPQCYKDKRVLVVGAGPSAKDLSVELQGVASQVMISVADMQSFASPHPSLLVRPLVSRVDSQHKRVFFHDRTQPDAVDCILLCTGYEYSFPFLGEPFVDTTDGHVSPLYRQLLSVHDPTLAFVGLQFRVLPFPLFEMQARFLMSAWKGEVELPCREEMLRSLETEYDSLAERQKDRRFFHELGHPRLWDYMNGLAIDAGAEPVEEWRVQAYADRVKLRREHLGVSYSD